MERLLSALFLLIMALLVLILLPLVALFSLVFWLVCPRLSRDLCEGHTLASGMRDSHEESMRGIGSPR